MGKRYFLIIAIFTLLTTPHLVFASKTHVARKSESLHSIAKKYHVSVEELKSVNNLSGTKISKGVKLIIPSNSESVSAKQNDKPKNYVVAKGDTLPRIAKKTGVKMADIRKFNKLKGNRIKVGQTLALLSPAVEKVEAARSLASTSRKRSIVNSELLNEQEMTSTLSELTDLGYEEPVDLGKSIAENSSAINKLKKNAYSFLGARYVFGGNSKNALDCSSFVQQVFRKEQIALPRTAREQFNVGEQVVRGDLRKGDLVFFQTYANFPSHVGIYLGNRKMIHASSRDRRVIISTMDTPYYLSRYLGARRVSNHSSEQFNFDEFLIGVEEENANDASKNDLMDIATPTLN